MQWYYAIDGQRQGPVSQEEFERLARDGAIKADTLVWYQGLANWLPYATAIQGAAVSGSAPASASPAGDGTEVCAVSGKRYPKREMIQYEGKWISAEHRDEFFQRLREGVAQPKEFRYGGFWLRFCAKFVDGLALAAIGVLINMTVALLIIGSPNYFGAGLRAAGPGKMMLFQAVTVPINLMLALAYSWFFISRYDATPGKLALGLKLIRPDGSRLSTGRIVGRFFSEYISLMTLYIGYIMAGFDQEKRALHDRICDTRVIKAK
jgi:uncharacterized RDD family membrane protein YckC